MPEREHEPAPASPARRPPPAAGAAPPAAAALARQVGNRGMGRVLARMEATEAVEALEQSLGAGVLGAERRVVDTITALSSDVAGFDQVSTDYEAKLERPLQPDLGRVPRAAGSVPAGWYPGIAG